MSKIRSAQAKETRNRPHRRSLNAWIMAAVGAALALSATGCAPRNKPDPLIVVNPAYERADWRYGSHPGQRITSEHYDFYTTITDSSLFATLPQVMETAYRNYRRLVPAPREPSEKMKIYLFAQRAEFEHFTKQLSPQKAATLLKVRNGGFSEQGVTVLEYVSHEATFPLMTHEGFHQYLDRCVRPNVPAWLNEGLAAYCEGFRGSAEGISDLDPWLNPLRRNALADALLREQIFPLSELLRINAGHVIGGSDRKISTYYAQVWALMLFLEQGLPDEKTKVGRYAASFDRLRKALAEDNLESFAQAAFATSNQQVYSFGQCLFSAFVGSDFDAIEKEYVRFMRQRILNEK
ncbi:MAG: hypothetical protein HZB38_03830 [Planctomycetes bacterium]|nr:hypothetical protein [Planctomycetota bacterium]